MRGNYKHFEHIAKINGIKVMDNHYKRSFSSEIKVKYREITPLCILDFVKSMKIAGYGNNFQWSMAGKSYRNLKFKDEKRNLSVGDKSEKPELIIPRLPPPTDTVQKNIYQLKPRLKKFCELRFSSSSIDDRNFGSSIIEM